MEAFWIQLNQHVADCMGTENNSLLWQRLDAPIEAETPINIFTPIIKN